VIYHTNSYGNIKLQKDVRHNFSYEEF